MSDPFQEATLEAACWTRQTRKMTNARLNQLKLGFDVEPGRGSPWKRGEDGAERSGWERPAALLAYLSFIFPVLYPVLYGLGSQAGPAGLTGWAACRGCAGTSREIETPPSSE